MIRSTSSDKGQTIPLFIVAAMALLFLAFALFAVGQAAVHRSSTQSAADAAALAAAQEAREEIEDDLRRALLTGDLTAVAEILATTVIESPQSCAEARRFADRNEAEVTSCVPVPGPPGYTISVVSSEPLGKSDVEGTEDKFAKTDATAVIEPRCLLNEGDTQAPPDPEPPPGEDDDDEEEDPPAPIEFDCDGSLVSIDPGDLDLEIDIAEFFSVRLRD